MRYKAGSIPSLWREFGAKEAIHTWWEDVPQRHCGWWKVLLFEDGQGWLRWAEETRKRFTQMHYDPPEQYIVAPPLRRAWFHAKFIVGYGYEILRNGDWRTEWSNLRIADMGLREKHRMSNW